MSSATTITRARKLSFALPALDAVGLLTGIVYLLFFAAGFVSLTDPDYWWHLRTGHYIVQTHSVPHHDIFSFTVAGKHWIAHEWLSEVLIYLGVARLGYAATLGLFVAGTLASFALMQRLLLRIGTPPLAAVLLVVLGMMISAPFWTVRPQLVSWAFVALFISVLMPRRQPAWLLVPAMVLWTNLHLEFVLGVVIVALWFAARLWERRDGIEFDWRSGAAFVLACALATLVNPFGVLLPLHALPAVPILGGGNDLSSISEWASPNFHQPSHIPLLAGIAVLIALAFGARTRDRFAVMLALAFTALALYSSRFQPLFAIAFLPAAGLAARDLRPGHLPVGAQSRAVINWALIGVTAIVVLVAIPMLPNSQTGAAPRTDAEMTYPSAGLAWLEEHQPDAKVFANYAWGGYVLNGLYPTGGRVFIDGRSEMYGTQVKDEYRTISGANDGWQELLEGSGADAVLTRPERPLVVALRTTAGWSLVVENETEVLFVRTSR